MYCSLRKCPYLTLGRREHDHIDCELIGTPIHSIEDFVARQHEAAMVTKTVVDTKLESGGRQTEAFEDAVNECGDVFLTKAALKISI